MFTLRSVTSVPPHKYTATLHRSNSKPLARSQGDFHQNIGAQTDSSLVHELFEYIVDGKFQDHKIAGASTSTA